LSPTRCIRKLPIGGDKVAALDILDTQDVLEHDLALGLLVHLGVGEMLGVAVEVQHVVTFPSSPVTIADFANEVYEGVVRQVPELSDQFSEELGPGADNLLKVLRDLAGHSEEKVGVFAQFLGKKADLFLGRWGKVATFDFGQVGGFDANALRDLAQGVAPVVAAQGFALVPNVFRKGHTK